MKTDWTAIDRAILETLDLRAEYETLGVRFANDTPNEVGYLRCFPIGSDSRNDSAAVSVAGKNGRLGNYGDKADKQDGREIGFFEFAARHGSFMDWRDARKHYAQKVGVELPTKKAKGKKVKPFREQVELLPHFDDTFAEQWAKAKGLDFKAVARANPLAARWPKNAPPGKQLRVIAFRADWPSKEAATAVVLVRIDSKPFPVLGKLSERKAHNLRDGNDGLILFCTRKQFTAASVVWKCEGISDAAALAGFLPAGHVSVTNSHGCRSCRKEWIEWFKGKTVYIVGDADIDGQRGAERIAAAAFDIAKEVKLVALPYPVVEKKGKDLRDYLADHSFDQLHELADSSKPLTERPKLATTTQVQHTEPTALDPIANFKAEFEESEEKNGEIKTKAIETPLTINSITSHLFEKTDNWPRRVGNLLFVYESDRLTWIEKQSALFACLKRRDGLVEWKGGQSYVSKEEIFENLKQVAIEYEAIETLPHEPPIDKHFYAYQTPKPGKGEALETLVNRFCPASPNDWELICCIFATLIWGGPAGGRPAFLITAREGRGVGKSKLALIACHFAGRHIELSTSEEAGKIRTRLLSPDALKCRSVLLDNIKSHRFSWADLESLITCSTISGHRLYSGDATRPNTLVWFLTLNGASLSRDMAQRCVVIELARPTYSGNWEEETRAYIDQHRQAIVADLIAWLRRPAGKLAKHTRWGAWESQVLARADKPDELQSLILDRQKVADVEAEESGEIEAHFADRLADLNYDVEADRVFIPSQIVRQWFNEATGDRQSPTTVSRRLIQMIDEGTVRRLSRNKSNKLGRGFVWAEEHSTGDVQACLSTRLDVTRGHF